MTLTAAPHISRANPSDAAFVKALSGGCQVLKDSGLCVYLRHQHYDVPPGQVLFEEPLGPGRFAMYPVELDYAVQMGLPSCWAIGSNGEAVPVRYAAASMHEGCGIDVTAPGFQTELAGYAQAIAAAGWHEYLELNLSAARMPADPDTQLTYEQTDEGRRRQLVTIVPRSAELMAGAERTAACWLFRDGVPVIRGVCEATNHDHQH